MDQSVQSGLELHQNHMGIALEEGSLASGALNMLIHCLESSLSVFERLASGHLSRVVGVPFLQN